MEEVKKYLQYTNLLGEIFRTRIDPRLYKGSYLLSAAVIGHTLYTSGKKVVKETPDCPLKMENCQGCVTNNRNRLRRELTDQALINVVPTFGFLPLYAIAVTRWSPIATLVTTPFMVSTMDNFMVDLVNVNRLSRPTNKDIHLQRGDPQLPYKW